MKKVFRALLICFLVAALAATSFVIPVSAATVEDDSNSVGTIFEDRRVKSYDSRVALIYSEFPNGDKGYGTAFIFANNALMTAGHCLYNYSLGGEAKKVEVYIYSNGNFVEVYTPKKIIRDERANIVDWGYGDCYKYDWGIIELDANIGNKYGCFDFDTEVTKNNTLTLTGFPGDKGGLTQYTESGNVFGINENVIDHKISACNGNSGGPTYKTVDGKDKVVGILIGGDKFYNSSKRIDEELYNIMMKISNDHYYIKYHADEESSPDDNMMKETIVRCGIAEPLRSNIFTKAGARFVGWTAYRRSTREWCYKNPTTGKPEWYTVYAAPSGWEKYIYHDKQLTANASNKGNIVDMYAQWDENSTTYNIYYKSNGGEGSMNPTTAKYGVKTKLSANTFTNGSRAFLGWKAYRSSDMKRLFKNPNNPSECKWSYTSESETFGWEEYVFKDIDYVYNLTGIDDDSILLTAQWGDKTGCTVYYDANGGNGIMDSTFIKYGIKPYEINFILSKNTFNKDNYEFAGWMVKQEYNNDTIESKWLYENPANSLEKCWYNEENAPEGWTKCIYKDGDRFKAIKYDDKSKIIMCAQWKKTNNPCTYTINYNANGGSGTMDSTQCTCNVPTKLAKNTFTNGENKFAGWSAHRSSDDKWFYRNPKNGAYSGWYKENSQPAGWTKALYSNGCYVTMSSDFKNDKITLYAQWKKIGTNLSNNNTTEVIKGDVDGDGALTINDVTKLQRYLAEFESFNDKQMKAADVNNDGEVNVKDITAMQCLINN